MYVTIYRRDRKREKALAQEALAKEAEAAKAESDEETKKVKKGRPKRRKAQP
jgi:hypothetical protein